MTSLAFTHHATQRCNQRGISVEDIDFILTHGSLYHHQGCEIVSIDKKDVKFLMNEPSVNRQLLFRAMGKYVVLNNETVITVAHRLEKFKQDYWN
ncbi:hypothetical protein [Pseudidiomarina salilacus]|uniref:hypothetical protein n=1 Tax=Pseudidiomarina salilacus TaxID=3384452 RepID=UPI003984C765